MKVRKYRAAGGVVIDRDKMLLLDRPGRGEVRLPKGHVEAGESTETTALRETQEESGYLDLVVVADLGSRTVEFEYKGAHVIRDEHYYLMKLLSDRQGSQAKADAVQFEPIWLPLAEAVATLTFPAEQEVARKAIDAYRERA